MKYLAFTGYTLFIISISVLAYLNVIPTKKINIPYYDYVGHFILYGIWAYLFAMVLPKNILPFIPVGILFITLITIVEECLQSFSSVRSFSLVDMGCSIAGIILGGVIFNLQSKAAYK